MGVGWKIRFFDEFIMVDFFRKNISVIKNFPKSFFPLVSEH